MAIESLVHYKPVTAEVCSLLSLSQTHVPMPTEGTFTEGVVPWWSLGTSVHYSLSLSHWGSITCHIAVSLDRSTKASRPPATQWDTKHQMQHGRLLAGTVTAVDLQSSSSRRVNPLYIALWAPPSPLQPLKEPMLSFVFPR